MNRTFLHNSLYATMIYIKHTNRKRARTQIQFLTSPQPPIFRKKWPHPMNHIFPTNLHALTDEDLIYMLNIQNKDKYLNN